MKLISKGNNKRKTTIRIGDALYNITRPALQRLCLTGMSQDGVTGKDVEALGATRLTAPVPDADVTGWRASDFQAALHELLGAE